MSGKEGVAKEAVELDPTNSFAQRMQKKAESGKKLSNWQVGELFQQNETAIRKLDSQKINSAVKNRLVELGETGNVEAIAAALTKQAQGEGLTRSEKRAIQKSRFGQRVANELNPENIKSGEYSSEWAEKIGTERINAEEYSRLIAEMESETTAKEAENTQTPATALEKATTEVPSVVETPQTLEETAQASTKVTQTDAPQAKIVSEDESVAAEENATEDEFSAYTDAAETEESSITLESASKKYGAQAAAMVSTYTEGQNVEKYDAAYSVAYNMGKSGVNLSYAMNSESTQYLTESQRKNAYDAGADASSAAAKAQDVENKTRANGNTGHKKGTVKGDGVTIADINKAVNDKQGTAYKLLSTYAEATGIDIVLYKSSMDEDGVFVGAQGKFKWNEDTIYIDINAGLDGFWDVNNLANYTMLRTFAHEFTHFIEKWNPIHYNEFRKVVFDTITERGENVDELISLKMALDTSGEMTYDEASREVVAEAMTDILPDANFVEELATKHKTLFNKLLERLKEFVSDLKAYFSSLSSNRSREANALKEQVGESVKYVESIVKLFDKVAVEAVENYQTPVALEEKADNIDSADTKTADNITVEKESRKSATTVSVKESVKEVTADPYIELSKKLGKIDSVEQNGHNLVIGGSQDLPNGENQMQEQSRTYLNANKENINEREETRDNFYRRSNAEIRAVRERGQTAYGYRAVLPEHVSRSAKTFTSEVQKHGIQAIVHNGLEFNKNGITKTNIGKASTVAGDVIYVKNDIDIDPIEAAGHEMFHFWKKTARRQTFTNILEDNIIFSSQAFIDFQSQIAQLYFEGEVGFNDDNWLKLAEEIYAYISGIIHSGDTDNIVRPFLRNFDEVKSAWNDYIEADNITVEKGSRKSATTVSVNESVKEITAADIESVTSPNEKSTAIAEKLHEEVEELSLDGVDEGKVQEQSRAYSSDNKYSYEWFANKPDMVVTSLDSQMPTSRADVINEAKKKPASVGKVNKDGSVSVYVNDIGADVILSKKGLAHGLDRRFKEIAPATIRAGEIISNSIKINELVPSKEEADTSYVLIGVAKNPDGDIYIVRSVVNKFSSELTTMDVLYAISAKKSTDVLNAPLVSTPDYRTTISISQLLEYVNEYFPDVLPESVLKHFGYEARPDGTLGKDVLYQQRTTTLTDREVLAMAADALQVTELTDAERDALQILKNRLAKLETLQSERKKQGKLYLEQQFGASIDRDAAAQTLNRMHVLDEQIKAAEADVLSVENKKVFGDVLKKARKIVEADQRAHDAELVKRWRDRTQNAAAIKKYRECVKKDVNELSKWLIKPDNKDIIKHIPEPLKNSVRSFLASINFTSEQQLTGNVKTKADEEFVKRLEKLKLVMGNSKTVNELYEGYTDLPLNFTDKLQKLIDATNALIDNNSGEFVINKMTSEELKNLSEVVANIKAYITHYNKFHYNGVYSHVSEAGDDTIDALALMESDKGKADRITNFVLWQQIRPVFAFERFGRGGKAIYNALRRGQAQLAFNAQKITEFTKNLYTDKEVKAWEKEIHTIRLSNGKTIKMRTSMAMSFYELSKRPQALGHILGKGIRVAVFKESRNKYFQETTLITEGDLETIIGVLTDRQKAVADSMQRFMQEVGGAWGNYVSIKRFGIEQFGEEHYFPIHSDGTFLQVTADERPGAASLYALLNMGFTKQTVEKADNAIVLYSIFDVFSNHMASMAQYNAMALPVVDAIKWFNYQQKTEDAEGNITVKTSVREQMRRVYGAKVEAGGETGKGYAESFVINILKAFNGTEAQGIPTDAIGMNASRRYNMAQVAYNFRVVVQQPLAIARAALLIDYSSIAKGIKLKPSAIKQNVEEMRKYSGIAAWKSLGFYDTNISRGLTEIIKHSSTLSKKIGEVGMWGAEKADTFAWAAMWSACKEEVIKKQKLTPKDEGFYEAVTTLFEDVIYKTQVVDSVLTKNEYLRSKGAWARLMGSFMSEPTTTASMLIDAYDKYNADLKRGMSRSQAWEKNRRMIGRTFYVYGVSAVILSAVQAVADALRDDDDYETFIEKWLEAFGGNLVDELMPINKLPYFSQGYEVVKEVLSAGGLDLYGQLANLPYAEIAEKFIKGTEILHDLIMKEDTNYTYYGGIYKLLQAVSGITGLPMATATREIITAWNNIVGGMAPSLKVKTYEAGEQNDIKYAYQDGYLTFEEAVQELIEQELVDNENEAYFTVSGWEAGDGYSRYVELENAVRAGAGVDEAMGKLLSHGYAEKDIYSHIRSKAGEWYKGGEISKQQATKILEQYTEMNGDEITKYINKWSSVVVTGIDYEDIGNEFMAGNITESRAIDMYIRYGSMTQEKAAEKVAVLSFVKEHPGCEGISYSAVEGYTQYCEKHGIDAATFYDVWQYKGAVFSDFNEDGQTISGSKKAKILDYIDSLELSKKQKDALYYALGYAKSTIKEAPWR